MKTAFLLTAGLLFFQGGGEVKPIIDNARVRVWEDHAPKGWFEFDTVLVDSDGKVTFKPVGSPASDAKLVIGLKLNQVEPLKNPTKFPLAMNRPGAKKVFEYRRVIVWDYRWTPGQPTPMHFHDKDVVVMYLEEGDLKSTTLSGEVTLNQYKPGMIRFNLRDRTHTEELVRGTERAIITELK
jgi:hypothetical protein